MPVEMKTVAEYTIQQLQFLDANGQATQALPEFAQDKQTMLACYRWICLTRHFDEKAMRLQRTGKLGTFAQAIGQEAVTVGIGQAMNRDDILCPYYRDHGTYLQRQVTMTELYQYWGGDERGSAFANNPHDLPPCIPIATQLLHAAGVASAIKYKNEQRAVVTTCGEGATSKGDFYEAINVAGLWYLPLVFVVNNNQWAISVPRCHQTASHTIAQKAIAAEVPCLQVDGNDVIAVRYAVEQALIKARNGKGPTLIEAITYRLCDHTTADDATRYQPAAEVEDAKNKEPQRRLKRYLAEQFAWTEADDEALHSQCQQEVEAAANAYLDLPTPKPEEMFDNLFATLPDNIKPQREFAINHAQNQEQSHG